MYLSIGVGENFYFLVKKSEKEIEEMKKKKEKAKYGVSFTVLLNKVKIWKEFVRYIGLAYVILKTRVVCCTP